MFDSKRKAGAAREDDAAGELVRGAGLALFAPTLLAPPVRLAPHTLGACVREKLLRHAEIDGRRFFLVGEFGVSPAGEVVASLRGATDERPIPAVAHDALTGAMHRALDVLLDAVQGPGGLEHLVVLHDEPTIAVGDPHAERHARRKAVGRGEQRRPDDDEVPVGRQIVVLQPVWLPAVVAVDVDHRSRTGDFEPFVHEEPDEVRSRVEERLVNGAMVRSSVSLHVKPPSWLMELLRTLIVY